MLARAKTAAVCEQALYVYRDAPEQGRDSTCMNPARWAKRLDGFGQVVPALKAEATAFANDPVRRGFLLRSAALAWQQRLILAAAAGKLAEIAREETANRDLLAYTPKRFGPVPAAWRGCAAVRSCTGNYGGNTDGALSCLHGAGGQAARCRPRWAVRWKLWPSTCWSRTSETRRSSSRC